VKVLKFGGSSVGTPERISGIISLVTDTNHYPPNSIRAIVVSAFQGVTDSLITATQLAAARNERYNEILRDLEQRHLDAVNLLIPPTGRASILASVKTLSNELADLLQGVSLLAECSARTKDSIMSFGERLSALLVTEAFIARGHDVEYLDTRSLIRTDEQFNNARPLPEPTCALIRTHFETHPKLQIATGFIAASQSGATTTLGRGGSDYSSSIIGAALQVSAIEIWTDVDGMLTADPRKVPKAFPIPEVSYEEALELCHFGAKVIYPPTIQPAIEAQIPLIVKNTFNPSSQGTRISAQASRHPYAITGISSVSQLALIRLEGSGMVGVMGTAMRLFRALAANSINVILITQASSEHTICCAIDATLAAAAATATDEEFKEEIQAGQIRPLVVEDNHAIVSVVGENMRNTPGMAGRIFRALGTNGINIAAIAQGSSELNISVVIKDSDVSKALNVLHDEFFFTSSKTVNMWILGTGLIGSTLMKQLAAQRDTLQERMGISLTLRAIANSRGMHLSQGLSEDIRFNTNLDALTTPFCLDDFVAHAISANLPHSIFVDCTASEAIPPHYPRLFQRNISVVTPNKRGPASELSSYRHLIDVSRTRDAAFLYETCVGAALPVISTLRDLITSGDTVHQIEAVLSGTLSFICNAIAGGSLFSEAVREAKRRGYTEPDPRDDLSGADVARKVLILAREAGLPFDLHDITIEPILPVESTTHSPEEFMARLPELDSHLEPLITRVKKEGKRLFFAASVDCTQKTARIGLTAVDLDHPFCSLAGSDNIVAFRTRRYSPQPLVVKGPGAGAEVTAAGVFADIVRASR
jgi:aspartokinase/homoserine dehydrogenase 1